MTYAAHPDYRLLLQAVLASPADDLPRLVMADWIEENGDPDRADRIRFMCANPRKWFRILLDLEHGVRAGLDGYTDQWVEADDDWSLGRAGAGWRGIYWHRGFVAGVRHPLADWYRVDVGPVLVRSHPVEHVRATDRHTVEAQGGYWWLRPEGAYELAATAVLPGPVFDRLGGFDREDTVIASTLVEATLAVGRGRRYRTAEAAHAALSSALRRWAHGTVPPFPRPA